MELKGFSTGLAVRTTWRVLMLQFMLSALLVGCASNSRGNEEAGPQDAGVPDAFSPETGEVEGGSPDAATPPPFPGGGGGGGGSSSSCGDGIRQQWEACDDGNTSDNDFCSADCQVKGLRCAADDFVGAGVSEYESFFLSLVPLCRGEILLVLPHGIDWVDTRTDTVLRTFPVEDPRRIAIDPDRGLLFATTLAGRIWRFDLLTGSSASNVPGSGLGGLLVGKNGKVLVRRSPSIGQWEFIVYDPMTNLIKKRIPDPFGGSDFVYDRTRDHVTTQHLVRYEFDVESFAMTELQRRRSASFRSIALSPDGRHLVDGAAFGGLLDLYGGDFNVLRGVYALPVLANVRSLEFSSNSQFLVAALGAYVIVYDAESRSELTRFEPAWGCSTYNLDQAWMAPDNRTVYVSGRCSLSETDTTRLHWQTLSLPPQPEDWPPVDPPEPPPTLPVNCSEEPVAVAEAQGTLGGVAENQGFVYWVRRLDGSIWSAPSSGGAATQVVADQRSPNRVQAAGNFIYWNNEGTYANGIWESDAGLYRVAASGGPVEAIVEGLVRVNTFAIHGSDAYVVHEIASGEAGWELLHVDLETKISTPLISGIPRHTDSVAVDAEWIYWSTNQSETLDYTARDFSAGGTVDLPRHGQIVARAGRVFFGANPGVLQAFDPVSVTTEVMSNQIYAGPWPGVIAADDEFAYVQSNQTIYKAPFERGIMFPRHAASYVDAIAVDSECMYWTDGFGRVMKAAK